MIQRKKPQTTIVNGIEKTPGVCGGDACVASTRIPVWVLVQAKGFGISETDLLKDYPTLTLEDLANAWAYAAIHVEEINKTTKENNEA